MIKHTLVKSPNLHIHLLFSQVICSLPLKMKFLIIFAAIIAISQATLPKQIIIKKIIRVPAYAPTYAAPEPVKIINTYPTAGDRYFVPKPEPIYLTKTVSYPAEPAYPSSAPLYAEPAHLPAYPSEPLYAEPAYPSEPAYPQPAYPSEPAYAPAPRKVIHIIEAPRVAYPKPAPAYPTEPLYLPEPAYPQPAYPQPDSYPADKVLVVKVAYPEPNLSYDEYKKK